MQLNGKRVLVVGLGRSGAAAAAFLRNRGARVTVTDSASEAQLGAAAESMRRMGVALALSGHAPEAFVSSDLIVVSPGVPHTLAPLAQAARAGIPVIGEMELAARFIRKPLVAVTGTNGKTTVTLMIGEMLSRSGLSVFVGGNIGAPLTGYADAGDTADVVVAEVSSFQLDTIARFRPHVGVLLNITADHMDRYTDFAAYAKAKARLFENQNREDVAIVNGSDPAVLAVCGDLAARKLLYTGRSGPGDENRDARVVENRIACRGKEGETLFLDLSRVRFAGAHNLENAAAACLAALYAGGTVSGIQAALDRFETPAHRMEYVSTVRGVRYVNDSKATNVDAVLRALEGFEQPVVLIMGGRDKGGDFSLLANRIRRHVKHLVVMGEAAETIARALGETASLERADGMVAAVEKASAAAAAGETVLLSPGCASFDQFTDYADRGTAFKNAVKRLL